MDETARREFLRMVAEHHQRGDVSGWCENVYRVTAVDLSIPQIIQLPPPGVGTRPDVCPPFQGTPGILKA
jgi:hypothetical protein